MILQPGYICRMVAVITMDIYDSSSIVIVWYHLLSSFYSLAWVLGPSDTANWIHPPLLTLTIWFHHWNKSCQRNLCPWDGEVESEDHLLCLVFFVESFSCINLIYLGQVCRDTPMYTSQCRWIPMVSSCFYSRFDVNGLMVTGDTILLFVDTQLLRSR